MIIEVDYIYQCHLFLKCSFYVGTAILCKTKNNRESCDKPQKWILDTKVGKDLLNVIINFQHVSTWRVYLDETDVKLVNS